MQDNPKGRSLSEESASEHKISTVSSMPQQETQEEHLSPDVEQGNVSKDKHSCSQDTLADCIPEGKVATKPEEIPSKGDKSTTKQLTETLATVKSDKKSVETKTANQSSSHLLKWTNKQPTQAKGKRKKE